MWKIWTYFKRAGASLVHQFKSAMPLLLLLGMVFLLVGIWWLGPHWTWRGRQPLAALSMRVLLTLVLLMVPVLAWALVLRSRNRYFEAESRQALARQADPVLRHVQAQERALDRSLALLRASLKGGNALYQLPWYLVLGQGNAGKTSFINRSGQNFSLTGEIRAGSRRIFADPDLAYVIDWWMGDQAVLIDPPGELVSQADVPTTDEAPPSTPVQDATAPEDAAAHGGRLPPGTNARLWESLVDWLGRNRSRRPLNGVVLMVDLVALLNQTAGDRKALAILLRTRLSDLSRQLGTRPPLYVVLSKFDLLDGFELFFSRLPRSVREDLFGFTFTLDSVQDYDAWLEELAGRYDGFIGRLNEQIFDALSEAGALAQREGLFSLVSQLAGMRQVLLGFLADVLGSDRYVTPALPRGVYFSSVYQQGLLSNAFVNAASQSYGLDEPVSAAQPGGRSMVYFAQQVFQRVIYPEAGLAGDNLKVLAGKKRMLAAGFGVAGLGSLLLIGGWYHYYGVNRDMAVSVLDKSREFGAYRIDGGVDPTGRNLVEPLNQIRGAVAVFGDYRKAWPAVSDMGLYQGRKIGPKVDEAYLRLLSTRFLPELASGVMEQIGAAPANSNAQLAGLRVYRMIEDRDNRRAPIVEAWMAGQWQAAFPGDSVVQNALMDHLGYAMRYARADLPQYRARVAELQQQLRQIPVPQRVYMALRAQAGEALRTPLDLRSEVGPAFDIVYKPLPVGDGPRIEALLTAKGYRGYFEPRSADLAELAMIDQWALGERRRIDYPEADRQALAEHIRAAYSRDYIGVWRRSLDALEIADFDDLDQAVDVLGSIASPAAPLRRLVETVRDNTVFSPAPAAQALEKSSTRVPASVGQAQADGIARTFAPLTDLLTARDGKPSYLDEIVAAIGSVHGTMKRVQDSPERGKAALNVVLNRFALKGPDPIGNLQRVAAGLPAPLDRQVKKLADESSQVLLIEALRELERRWDADVYGFYSQRLAGRYPFDPTSRTDVSLEDFAAMFGPEGRLQKFKGQYLKRLLEDNREALYSERRGGYLVRDDVLARLEAADRIRDAFFNSRGALGVQFTVEPLDLTATRRSSVLSVEGQLIAYSHGPGSGVGLIWPNSLGNSTESRITVVNGNGNSSSLAYRGSWSLFRLLGQARPDSATANSVDLSFTAGDGVMRYRITAEKASNPFTRTVFNGFVLPRTLLQVSPPVNVAAARNPKDARGGQMARGS